jgi:DNA-binding winged helix-turn-helix (wHTH) protein
MAGDDNQELLPDHRFRLGAWLVEPKLNRISAGETTVQLELRVMQLLVLLASRPGELFSRFEILDSVWRSRFVADNTLTHAVAEIRGALGDDPRRPTYLQTIPKRGYRLIAPVSRLEPVRPPRPGILARFRLVGPDGETVLREGENLIGRAPDSAVPIASVKVSRRHARILVEGGRAVLEDLESKNGTYLDGQRLTAPVELGHGDEIRIGRHAALFRFVVEDGSTRSESANPSRSGVSPPEAGD